MIDWPGGAGMVPDLLVVAAQALGVDGQRARSAAPGRARRSRPWWSPGCPAIHSSAIGDQLGIRAGSTQAVTPVISLLVRWKRIRAAYETGPCSRVGSRISTRR